MAVMFWESWSFLHFQYGHIFQPSEPSRALLLIMLGKVLLNLFLLRIRRRNLRESFMVHFCISLALVDLVLLVTMFFIFYFQDFMIMGIRFTKYHICLLAQIMAVTYGVLHYPISLMTGLDYYLTITKASKSPNVCRRLLYIVTVILTWISVLCYVLTLPSNTVGLDNQLYNSGYQCPFYISSQSYWLSLGMLLIICLAFVLCWSEVVAMVQPLKLVLYKSETVLFFPHMPECSPRDCAKHFLTRLLVCFVGNWAPFVFLQMLIVLLDVQIPAYIEMNVPWLYFTNSFLIAVAYWVRRRQIELTEEVWDADPFVNWKFCFVPFHSQNADEKQKPTSEIVIC
ncbi:probable G-protein coupled receptor 160 [Eublepharis macularius]|uniref:Probable G-protein coupled receptor 160 n=1 Tax=Eublepharis macularius TaxID=481883 RepID=A0AA97JIX8_EUBMA|nr:probable G-protein coupled receptor 160 [Eublepharis macularius]XP_054839079.1 probable G-protein coupled receptor 160 [Eublepharis macularius]XP_054839080.1 probable G-protein coupled receptor 160 [Eublepharis macularius]XP_054839081.1 probable G-protein coupled receptor 160 [Eublepharis macularius]